MKKNRGETNSGEEKRRRLRKRRGRNRRLRETQQKCRKEKKVMELSGIKWGVEICQSRATRDDDNFDYQTKLNGELKSVNQGAPRGGGNKKLVQKKGGAK